MKILFFALVRLLFPYSVSAQIIVKGKILDEKQQPLQSISITLSQKNSNLILTYSLSNKNGYYSLSWQGKADSLKLNVSALGYGKKEMIISEILKIK